MQRRERWAILGQVLAILESESAEPVALSRVAARANLPYDRFAGYLQELRDGGLVTADERPALTEKGRSLLRSWRQWEAVLQRFGLD